MSKIVIFDFGSQYVMLIARIVRELGYYSEIVAHNTGYEKIKELKPTGIILSGGPSDINSDQTPSFDDKILDLNVPIFGLCYGMQLITNHFGGKTQKLDISEFGSTKVRVEEDKSIILNNIENKEFNSWMSHGVSAVKEPSEFRVLAKSENNIIAVIENSKKNIYATQFHPEVKHSEFGRQIFKNFLELTGEKDWDMGSLIDQKVESIRKQVGDSQVICGLSGGVDSSVAAALVHKAIGDQLTCIFVDNGLLREGEREQVEDVYAKEFDIKVVTANAGEQFLDALKGVSEPEKKRKIIGEKFIRVFESEIRKLNNNAKFLVQGTLYPDVVESGGGHNAANIKSHHNVGGLPDDLQFDLVEPLRDLFKDEVRELGRKLGISNKIINRQPFPGPSLGIRIIGDITKEKVEILQRADKIVRDILTKYNLDDQIWQCPVVLLSDVRSVGVQGDERTYGHPIVIRPVQSDDAMTADWFRVPYNVLAEISSTITNQVRQINRVTLDITSKPPGTIEWE